MKVLLTLLVLFFSSSVAAYEWKKFGTTVDGTVFYYEPKSVIRFEQNIFLFYMIDYYEKSEWGDLSAIFYRKIDCNTFNFRDLVVYFYNKNMGNGKLTTAMIPVDENRSAAEGSIMENFFSFLCD